MSKILHDNEYEQKEKKELNEQFLYTESVIAQLADGNPSIKEFVFKSSRRKYFKYIAMIFYRQAYYS
jgi:hypothetical protein